MAFAGRLGPTGGERRRNKSTMCAVFRSRLDSNPIGKTAPSTSADAAARQQNPFGYSDFRVEALTCEKTSTF